MLAYTYTLTHTQRLEKRRKRNPDSYREEKKHREVSGIKGLTFKAVLTWC